LQTSIALADGNGSPAATFHTSIQRQSKTVSDSKDPFLALEEKLSRTLDLFRKTQADKRALEQNCERLRAESKERAKLMDALEKEIITLRREREDVKTRVEKLLEQIDGLTSSDSES
jgi:chromosome segregation ATPase